MNHKEEMHKCSANWYKDVVVRHAKINGEQWSWVLEQTWSASRSEVGDGLLGDEREMLSIHTLLISFCPFCGEELTGKMDNTW